MLKELLKTLSVEETEELLKAVYEEGKNDGWNENSIDNGYEGTCRKNFSELEEEILKEPKEFLKKWSK